MPSISNGIRYIGHACVLVEMAGLRILMDPWMVGPAHFNGWWHVPPLATSVRELGPIDVVMISHVHDDHFHLPTLEQLPKSATAVVPYSLDPWMGQTLRGMGFARVIEMEHGRPYFLSPHLKVENFHFGRLDSAYGLTAPDATLLNLNDCPVSPAWVKGWRRRHPAPDIAMGAFSYSSSYPLCYEIPGVDVKTAAAETSHRHLQQFGRNMAALGARYVVPIATQYGFLTPDEVWMNSLLPTPAQAIASLSEQGSPARGVLLNPGDSLSFREGPKQDGPGFDWGRRDALVAQLAREKAGQVQQLLREEPPAPPDLFERFRGYFEGVLGRNPGLRRRIGVPVAFMPSPGGERWVVDCAAASRPVSRAARNGAAIEVRLPSTVLYAALEGRIHWETLYVTYRARIKVPPELLGREWEFWRMLFNFRQGMLRDRLQFLTPRGLRILFRRRAEITGLLLERLRKSSQREPNRDV